MIPVVQVAIAVVGIATTTLGARRTMMVLQLWITAVELVMLGVGLLVGFWVTSSGAMTVGAVTAAPSHMPAPWPGHE